MIWPVPRLTFIQPARNCLNSGLHLTGPRLSSPTNAFFPFLSKMDMWMWHPLPVASVNGFAMKVTDMPSWSATSFRHCLYTRWRSAIGRMSA